MTRLRNAARLAYPTEAEFAAGARVNLADWPFAARVLLSRAVHHRELGLSDAAQTYRTALAVAARAHEVHP